MSGLVHESGHDFVPALDGFIRKIVRENAMTSGQNVPTEWDIRRIVHDAVSDPNRVISRSSQSSVDDPDKKTWIIRLAGGREIRTDTPSHHIEVGEQWE